MSSKKIINSIQFLRGFAALAVVVHHTGGYVKRYFEPTLLFGDYGSLGFAGVDLFFVISGFIIHFTSKNYLNNPSKLSEYLKKRFLRVYPIYWVITTVLFVSSWLITVVLHKNIFSIGYPPTFSAYFQTYTLFPLHFAINPVTWTLSYELFFYLGFALLIISKRLWIIPVLILGISLFHLISKTPDGNLSYFNFFFSGYNLEFLIGFLISRFYKSFRLPNWASLFFLFISVWIILHFGYSVSDIDTIKRVLVFGIPSSLILIALLNLEQNEVISFPKFSIMLGNSSYALYLIHFPMMLLMNKLPQIMGYKIRANQEVLYSYFIILITVIASVYVHQWLEKPLTKRLNSVLNP